MLGLAGERLHYILQKNIPIAFEGSIANFVVQSENKKKQDFKVDNLYLDNLVISDRNGFEYIANGIGTMNRIQNYDPKVSNLVKVKARTLTKFFQEKNINYADMIKIDIEGHEVKLVDDLLMLDIRSLFIEVGSFYPIDINYNFLLTLSKKFEIIDVDTYERIAVDNLMNYLLKKITENSMSPFDLFLNKRKST